MSASPLYFAYGSNLDADDCDRVVPGLSALLEPVGPAWWPDRALAFTRYSPGRGGGVLDLRPTEGARAHGLLYRVLPGGWDGLDEKEGAQGPRPAYRRVRGRVVRADGGETEAIAYEVVAPVPYVSPAPAYLALVRAARRRWALDLDELDRAAAAPAP